MRPIGRKGPPVRVSYAAAAVLSYVATPWLVHVDPTHGAELYTALLALFGLLTGAGIGDTVRPSGMTKDPPAP